MSQSGGIRGANISSSACGLTNSARVRISISWTALSMLVVDARCARVRLSLPWRHSARVRLSNRPDNQPDVRLNIGTTVAYIYIRAEHIHENMIFLT